MFSSKNLLKCVWEHLPKIDRVQKLVDDLGKKRQAPYTLCDSEHLSLGCSDRPENGY